MKNIHNYKKIYLLICDLLIITISYGFAVLFVQGLNVKTLFTLQFSIQSLLMLTLYLAIYKVLYMYNILWNVAGFVDYLFVILANIVSLFAIIFITVFYKGFAYSVSEVMIASGYILLGTLGLRMYLRISLRVRNDKSQNRQNQIENKSRVMIIGAGESAAMIIKEIKQHPELGIEIVGLVDDSPTKISSHISGFKVFGSTYEIPDLVIKHKIDQLILAMPSVEQSERSRILTIANTTNAKLKTLPGMYEIVERGINISSIRDVEITDLLGRKEIKLSNTLIANYIQDRVVLVTGGGGSIGSELCRQVAKLKPNKLIIVDIYENNAYDIQNELKANYPNLDLEVLIASVRDVTKINLIFEKYKPNIVFHAAAHKHVPLMETSPEEAIKNNVFGTQNVATAAKNYMADKFILISTDKAVNPTNIMGASKRLCEMIVQSLASESTKTEFVAVRFGNVLGSNGSVIPLFKEQIQKGGPVTLTHKDIVRYFMTIPEAVQLVLQAGSYAHGGEIFVLDMGEPVKIYDLAVNLIKLSGFEPNRDIEIKITGLRPGEKLYEELLMAEEGLESTPNDLIFVGKPSSFDIELLKENLQKLRELVFSSDYSSNDVKMIVSKIVDTYTPDI